ncbi:MAG: hypothetical protein IJP90_02100 [Treponema sp.]|nr:hypothetical protein [Treponema sp.]MBR0098490.1 hypothetical protein [Treponema sp.]
MLKKNKIIISIIFLFIATLLFSQSSVKVYVTTKGKKYHTATCRMIQKSAVTEMAKEDAIKAGYAPCKICKP